MSKREIVALPTAVRPFELSTLSRRVEVLRGNSSAQFVSELGGPGPCGAQLSFDKSIKLGLLDRGQCLSPVSGHTPTFHQIGQPLLLLGAEEPIWAEALNPLQR